MGLPEKEEEKKKQENVWRNYGHNSPNLLRNINYTSNKLNK